MANFSKYAVTFVAVLSGIPAAAAVCDYRPSVIVGQAATAAVGGVATTTVATGGALKAAGFYTLVHASSGLTMLGSTLAGASAAGTVGIIGGTAGAAGTIGAILLAPVTLTVAAVTAVGVGGYEAACYFADERITEYSAVLSFMEHLAEHHPVERFDLVKGIPGRNDDAIKIWNPQTEALDRYLVDSLYIVNGTLMHRKWGPNRNLGYIAFVPQADHEHLEGE